MFDMGIMKNVAERDAAIEFRQFCDEVVEMVSDRGQRVFGENSPGMLTLHRVLAATERYVKELIAGARRDRRRENDLAVEWGQLGDESLLADRDYAMGCEELSIFWTRPEGRNHDGYLWLSLLTLMARKTTGLCGPREDIDQLQAA